MLKIPSEFSVWALLWSCLSQPRLVLVRKVSHGQGFRIVQHVGTWVKDGHKSTCHACHHPSQHVATDTHTQTAWKILHRMHLFTEWPGEPGGGSHKWKNAAVRSVGTALHLCRTVVGTQTACPVQFRRRTVRTGLRTMQCKNCLRRPRICVQGQILISIWLSVGREICSEHVPAKLEKLCLFHSCALPFVPTLANLFVAVASLPLAGWQCNGMAPQLRPECSAPCWCWARESSACGCARGQQCWRNRKGVRVWTFLKFNALALSWVEFSFWLNAFWWQWFI